MTRMLLTVFFVLIIVIDIYSQQLSHASKQVSTFEIYVPQLQSTKRIWLYLPKNYENSTKQYEVIYMHDAQNLFDKKTFYAGVWNVDKTLDSLNAQVIIVAIEHGNNKRLEELTPFKNEKYGGGNADSYLDFIVQTLKPHIDSNYRTKSKAKNTTIFGSSLGGLVSFYAVLKYPNIFGKAGVFSPSFWYSKEIYTMMEKAPKTKAKIYFMCGDSEDEAMVPDFNKMISLLDKNRCYCLNLTKKIIVEGGKHNEKLWRENFAAAYLWIKN